MATPESKVKAKVRATLTALGNYHFMPPSNGFGRAGIPDIVGCRSDGRFFGIECKAGKGKTTALQERELERIEQAGGIALVINENNVDQLKELVNGRQ
jgi:Holliday junction resolvase